MTTSPSTRAESSRPVVRLTSPGEIAGAVPHLCGFTPHESVVAISLRGDRKRIGLTMRIDLPARREERAVAEECAARLLADGARRTIVVIYTDERGDRPRTRLVAALQDACRRRSIRVDDVLLVRAGRWASYQCDDERCCPAAGTPLDACATSPALGTLAAEHASEGRAVLASRDELEASIAPPVLLAREAAAQALQRADETARLDRLERGRQAVLSEAADRFREVLRRYADPPAQVELIEAAALTVALHDVLVRDEVATWALHDRDALLSLLVDLARQALPPYDAPVCTLLAWVAYAEGNGGLANVALERVFRSDPDYSLALLLRQALDAQVPPAQVRAVLRGTRSALKRRRRGR